MKISELKLNPAKEELTNFLLNLESDIPLNDGFYNELVLFKKNKRKRIIHEPIESLKKVQRELLAILYQAIEKNKILNRENSSIEMNKINPGFIRGVTAYRPSCSVIRNAHFHKNKELIIKLDINNFFGSVSEKQVNEVWRNIWSHTPKQLENGNQMNYSADEIHRLTVNSNKLATLNDSLPQGAPTSGYIANCVLDEFDKRVLFFCCKRNLSYSRYSDDITISGSKRTSKEIAEIISFVANQLKKYDFELHQRKIRVLKKHNRQIVTGIVVNEKLSVPRKLKKALRQEVYFLFKFAENHVKRHHSNIQKYLNRLSGKINWVIQVEKDNREFLSYRSSLKNLNSNLQNKNFSLYDACRITLENPELFVID